MNKQPKISALFLVLLLFCGAIGKAYSVPADSSKDFQHSAENTSSIYPASNPKLFAIPHQEKTGVNLLDRIPEPNSDHSQNYCAYLLVEATLQKHATNFLRFCQVTVRNLAVKKLIFPFHSYW
jgi:hypothetical protein